MGKWILHHFQFTVGQFRGVCGGVGWSCWEWFGINKTDFSRWLWNDADEVLVKLFRVSATYPLDWKIWMTSSTIGSGEGTRSGLIDIIPINSIKTTKPQLIATLTGQIEQRSIRRSWYLAYWMTLHLQRVRTRPMESVSKWLGGSVTMCWLVNKCIDFVTG